MSRLFEAIGIAFLVGAGIGALLAIFGILIGGLNP